MNSGSGSVSTRATKGGFDRTESDRPTDRGKKGSKIHLTCDRNGLPIPLRISAAKADGFEAADTDGFEADASAAGSHAAGSTPAAAWAATGWVIERTVSASPASCPSPPMTLRTQNGTLPRPPRLPRPHPPRTRSSALGRRSADRWPLGCESSQEQTPRAPRRNQAEGFRTRSPLCHFRRRGGQQSVTTRPRLEARGAVRSPRRPLGRR